MNSNQYSNTTSRWQFSQVIGNSKLQFPRDLSKHQLRGSSDRCGKLSNLKVCTKKSVTERSYLDEHAYRYHYSLISFYHFSGVHFYSARLNLKISSSFWHIRFFSANKSTTIIVDSTFIQFIVFDKSSFKIQDLVNIVMIIKLVLIHFSYFKYSSCSLFVSSSAFKQLWQITVRNSTSFLHATAGLTDYFFLILH